MHTPRRLIFAVLVSLMAMPPIATAQIPATATPSVGAIACDELASYRDDVSRAANATLEEHLIAREARGGWSVYREMSKPDLHVAHLYYYQWAHFMTYIPEQSIPDGLEEYHDIYILSLQAHADAILAYLDDDPDAYASLAAEVESTAERQYVIERAGVEQCGDTWINVFGEPSDPTLD